MWGLIYKTLCGLGQAWESDGSFPGNDPGVPFGENDGILQAVGEHLTDEQCIDLFRVVSLVGPVRIMLGWIEFQVIPNTANLFLLMVEFGLCSKVSYPAGLVAEIFQ